MTDARVCVSYQLDDTIVAMATAPGGAARGVVRLSGTRAVACLQHCFTPAGDVRLEQLDRAVAIPGLLQLDPFAARLPCDLYLWPTRRSYTREPVAELHTIGSTPLLQCLVEALCAAGARMAEPGEFTLRAFLAGRIDLTQAEAVLGVIDAVDQGQLDVALGQLAGGIGQPLAVLRDELLESLAHLEAGLDFVEEDIQFITQQQLDHQLAAAAQSIARLSQQMQSRGHSAGQLRVVLIGTANAGKSSLFNALAQRRARRDASDRSREPSGNVGLEGPQLGAARPAITSSQPGTTRDYLTVELDLDGVACQLIDTAGVCDQAPTSGVDHAAHELATGELRQADIRLLCIDSTRPMTVWEKQQLGVGRPAACIPVLTKVDAPRATDLVEPAVETSSHTGRGLERLGDVIREAASGLLQPRAVVVAQTADRCRESLRLAAESLERARQIVARGGGDELVAAELQSALAELGKVTGALYTDDLLDRIFSRFCIGK